MKKYKYIACSIGTVAVWVITAFLLLAEGLLFVTDILDIVIASLVLLSACLSTAAIWWCPRSFIGYFKPPEGEELNKVKICTTVSQPLNSPCGIWWKVLFISAAINIVTLPLWIMIHFQGFPESYPIPLYQPLFVILILPVIYLHIFSLWHWRTRYGGNHHIAWPILFVVTAWPLFSMLPASVFIALAYCFLNLVPDARGVGAYKNPASPALLPPATPLPKSFQLVKSACFVLGWTMVVGGVFAALVTCLADFHIWNIFESTLPNEIGNQFTESMSNALWCASQIAKTTSLTCLLATLAAAVGAVLIQISQRLRWRLLEEQEKEELIEDI